MFSDLNFICSLFIISFIVYLLYYLWLRYYRVSKTKPTVSVNDKLVSLSTYEDNLNDSYFYIKVTKIEKDKYGDYIIYYKYISKIFEGKEISANWGYIHYHFIKVDNYWWE